MCCYEFECFDLGIHSCNDLVQIMEMVINCIQHCHDVLGRYISKMQTELPSMTAVFEKKYQLKYNESYTGNLPIVIVSQ